MVTIKGIEYVFNENGPDGFVVNYTVVGETVTLAGTSKFSNSFNDLSMNELREFIETEVKGAFI
jgi:hypothetical protein